jgi:hypothetical protein
MRMCAGRPLESLDPALAVAAARAAVADPDAVADRAVIAGRAAVADPDAVAADAPVVADAAAAVPATRARARAVRSGRKSLRRRDAGGTTSSGY